MAHDFLRDDVHQYLLSVSLREPPILQKLRHETQALPHSNMILRPEAGQLYAFLVQLMGARRTLDIGVFTGYSSLAVALALPADGRVVACDVSEEYTSVARRYWQEAGVDKMIELRLQPAMTTLHQLLHEGHAGRFDFASIDADKPNYPGYYETVLELLRPGGLIAVDNVLWSARVVDPSDQEANTVAIRLFNEKLAADSRISLTMLPLADGVTLAMKR